MFFSSVNFFYKCNDTIIIEDLFTHTITGIGGVLCDVKCIDTLCTCGDVVLYCTM